jgi:hypothetical protein
MNISTNPTATWAEIFDWERMEDDIEAAASGTGDRGDYAVYLTYQRMGSTPLESNRTHNYKFFVPINLRPEEQIKYAITRQKNRKKITCRYWAAGTCPAGVDCEYKHPKRGEEVGDGGEAARKGRMKTVWR